MNIGQEERKDGINQITIDDIEFTIQPFGAMEALRLKNVVVSKFGPALGELVGGLGELKEGAKIEDFNISGDNIAKGISTLFAKLNEDEFISLIKRFLKNTICLVKRENDQFALQLNSENNIDKVFRQKTFTIYKLIVEIVKVNYPDFFDMVGDIGYLVKTNFKNILEEKEKNNLKK